MVYKKTFFSIIILLWLLPNTAASKIEHPKQADTAKECAICHYRWVSTFFMEHRGTPLTPLMEEQVVGDQEMCLSCHDGSVHDSRDKVCNDPGHRVGNIPSDRVQIPEKFPLDENGAMQCTTCHTPHAMKSKEGVIVEFFIRAPNKNSSFCKLCHIKNIGGKTKGNHPIDISATRNPQAIIKAGGVLGTDLPNQIICETCHIPHGGINNKFLVLSAEDPHARSVLCEVCHTQNPGMAKDPSLNHFSHPLDLLPGKVAKIPKKWSNGKTVTLGTGGELVCRTCHKPHYAADREFLLADFKEKDSLCIECHRDHARIAGSPHDLKVSAPEYINMLGETSTHAGLCSPCHSVHNANEQKFIWSAPLGPSKLDGWNEKYTSEGNLVVMVCTGCHSEGNAAGKQLPPFGLHPRGLEIPEDKRIFANKQLLVGEQFPVYNERGELTTEGNIVCSTCHNPHQWDPHNHTNGRGVQAEGSATTSFLRPDVDKLFCAECHGEDSLFKFKFFHSTLGREKAKSPFQLKQKDIKKQ
jgi:predicted CXXCH cytochrome family protein